MSIVLLVITSFVLFYIIYLIFFWQWKKNCQPFYDEEQTLVFGHRGSPALITENTLPSFQKAIDQKVDGLELDIRLSADGQIVVFHDSDLSRLSDQSDKISTLTLVELQAVTLQGSENQLQGVYIPSLNDIIPLFDYVKVFNIEIKSDGFFKGHDILTPLIDFLNKHQIDDKCIISSFNPLILMRLRLQRPETVIGFLYNRKRLFHGWDNMIWMFRVQPENLHIHYSMLNHWIVKWARKKGMRINSYTINDKNILDRADIDGVFTDNIEYIK
tara:strand:- start:8864 stop:9679 length:816 start_codon:yes stop_codon:yes gene_type:complete